jgi:peptidoglycan/LPS O-acetylase OafA/YrhL
LGDSSLGHAFAVTAPAQPIAPLRPSRDPSTRRPLLGRSPALDGLRGLALIWVVSYHFTGYPHLPFPGAWVGLDVFFVLSGFLITAMLLDEARVNDRVSMRLFYARRAFRLLPALFVMLGIWTVALLLFHDTTWFAATPGHETGDPVDVGAALRQVGIVLVYGVNWVYALGSGDAPLAHLWSLAVEEQFYVVWPWLLLLLLKLPAARRIWPVLVMAAISASLPFFYYDGGEGTNRIYFGTDTRAVGMLLGAVAALAWHRPRSTGAAPYAPTVRAWLGLATVFVFLFTVGNIPLSPSPGRRSWLWPPCRWCRTSSSTPPRRWRACSTPGSSSGWGSARTRSTCGTTSSPPG